MDVFLVHGLGCCSFKRTEYSSVVLGSNSTEVLNSIGHKGVLACCFLIVGTYQFVKGILCFKGTPIVVHPRTSVSVSSALNNVVHWHMWFYTVVVVVPLAHLSIAFKLDFFLMQHLYSCFALVVTDLVFGLLAGVPKTSSIVFYGQGYIKICIMGPVQHCCENAVEGPSWLCSRQLQLPCNAQC